MLAGGATQYDPRRTVTDACVIQTIDSPLGPLLGGACSEGVCLLEFPEPARVEAQITALRQRFQCAIVQDTCAHLEQLGTELAAYFAGRLRDFTVPLAVRGTPFQERVWAELRRIPYGETRSYERVARAIGAPGAPRAVGHANGMNRIAIVVPCHRVVNKNGTLGGYGGRLWRKEALLRLEAASIISGS